MTTTHTAICERADDWWEITVRELESGRVTQAKSLDDVEDTVRDLVALMTDVEPESVAVDVRALNRDDVCASGTHSEHEHSDHTCDRPDYPTDKGVIGVISGVFDLVRGLMSRAVNHIVR